jgi:hypothetical protein
MRAYGTLLALVVVLLTILGVAARESFISTGTIVQLQTSHVPTRAELEERECLGGLYGCVYRTIPFGF